LNGLNVSFSGMEEFPSRLRVLLAGQAGVGKTTFASNFPNPLWVNAACGLTTLARIGGIPFINFSCEMDLFAVKQMIESDHEKVLGFKIETLVVDSVDEMQRVLLSERLKSENRSETKLEDWGWLSNRMHAIFSGLTQLPVHVVFVCHTKEVTFFDNTIFKPALAGQFCEHIHEYVDMSLLMHASTLVDDDENFDVKRWVVSTPQFEAEWVHDKTGTLPPKFEANEESCVNILDGFSSVDLTPSHSVEICIGDGIVVSNVQTSVSESGETADYEITADNDESMLDDKSRDEVVEKFLTGLKTTNK
jgi:hypothetical protein